MRRLLRGERGMSITEVTVASAIVAIAAAAFYTTFAGFLDNVHDEELKSRAQDEGRLAVSAMVIDLRQAIDLTGNEAPVIELKSRAAGDDTDSIEFFSDRVEVVPGPERYLYELRNCAEDICELWQKITYAVPPAAPPYVFPNEPDRDIPLLQNVSIAGPDPVFAGVSWATGAAVTTSSCDGTVGNECAFNLVEIHLELDPDPDSDGGPGNVQFQEQVRMRNA